MGMEMVTGWARGREWKRAQGRPGMVTGMITGMHISGRKRKAGEAVQSGKYIKKPNRKNYTDN
jgi:hypothetical protein